LAALAGLLDLFVRGMAHGRPLRVGRRRVTPAIRATQDWSKGPEPDTTNLDAATREALTELWLHDAKAEHASVPAFARVAWQLAALGAPPDLIARTHQSALEEIDHAQRCFALASSYAQTALGPMSMPELTTGMGKLPRDRVRALTAIATETLADGALLESYSAALARVGLDDVVDAAARETLERIALDETGHAELAWDIIAFCVDAGGSPVVRALVQTAKTLASTAPAPCRFEHLGLVALADPAVLRAHGRVRPDAWAPTYARCRAKTHDQLAHLVSKYETADRHAVNRPGNVTDTCAP